MHNSALVAAMLSLAACSGGTGGGTSNDSEPDNSQVENIAVAADWPNSLKPFGDGYPKSGDPCRRVGESEATSNYLDDSADLVGCPTTDAAKSLGGKVVGEIDGITLVSVPTGSANTGMAGKEPSGDPIRGKGGLEEKCLAKVGDITRARVNGTNRIEESEAAVDIYVNVEGAQAPWKCVGQRDGSLGDVSYTGSEGDL